MTVLMTIALVGMSGCAWLPKKTITAVGSAKFPKGYHDFVRALDAMLAESDHQAET